MVQLKGFHTTYTDDAIKSGMIGSITNNACDYLDFTGFDRVTCFDQCFGGKIWKE